jgi:hypothetical protein
MITISITDRIASVCSANRGPRAQHRLRHEPQRERLPTK